jgi:hypothetical protein
MHVAAFSFLCGVPDDDCEFLRLIGRKHVGKLIGRGSKRAGGNAGPAGQ